MTLSWTATLTDGSTIDGTVQIPEVSHEAIDGLSDYSVSPPPSLFPSKPLSSQPTPELTSSWVDMGRIKQYNFTSSAAGTPAYLSLRKFLPSILEPFFTSFRQVLVEVHGKDMLVSQAPSPASSSGAATPAAAAPAVVAPAATSASSASETKKAGSSINTSEVSVSANLQISAADLWNLLTNEQKVGLVPSPSQTRTSCRLTFFLCWHPLSRGTVDPQLVALGSPVLAYSQRALLSLLLLGSRNRPLLFPSLFPPDDLGAQVALLARRPRGNPQRRS